VIPVFQSSQFKKELKRAKKRGKELGKLWEVVRRIAKDGDLEERHRDHPLSGNWAGWRDCHIEPDWLLIYRRGEDGLFLERTGSHSDLFR